MFHRIVSKFSGIWTRPSDGEQFDCILTPKNKLKFTVLQTEAKHNDHHESKKFDNVFTVNLHKRTITDDGKSNVKGIYNPNGFIVWTENITNILWMKGIIILKLIYF